MEIKIKGCRCDGMPPVLADPRCRSASLTGPRPAVQNFARRGESLPAQTALVLSERKTRSLWLDDPARLTLVWLSRWFDWRNVSAIVTPRPSSVGTART